MLFELGLGGHRPGYLQHLIRFWQKQNLPGDVDVMVRPEFIRRYPDIVQMATADPQQVRFVPLTIAEETTTYQSGSNAKTLAFREWQLMRRYTERLKTTHALVMYFDFLKLPTALKQPLPCVFSGIYFRPTFHYSAFGHYHPTWTDRLQQWQEKQILAWVFRHPQLKNLFCLDPFVLNQLDRLRHQVNTVHLPDPVQIYPGSISPVELKQKLAIESERQVFLLFGDLNSRKGLYPLLDAIAHLSPTESQKLCLLLVGPISAADRDRVHAQIQQLTQTLPVQIVTQHEFVSDRDVQPYFQAADVILAPYQRHIGMSAILVRAATAQKPVLCSDYGLMGELTRRYQLGLAIDSTQPQAIAQGIQQFLKAAPGQWGNPQQMQQLAQQNTAEQFATVIFNHLLEG
jgi:glycosyltransferase involved in cell wall biosynthesis